jgi:putative acetyltransferase
VPNPRFVISQAESSSQLAQARALFVEYADSLGFSLCFQNFDHELATLPGEYAPPNGRLLLAEYRGQIAGCVALHPLHAQALDREGSAEKFCEMKRLYLRPQFRGKGLGRVLAEAAISEARSMGYSRMRLDTVEPVMPNAVAMYRRLGFKAIEPYRPNPIEGALYMELDL